MTEREVYDSSYIATAVVGNGTIESNTFDETQRSWLLLEEYGVMRYDACGPLVRLFVFVLVVVCICCDAGVADGQQYIR